MENPKVLILLVNYNSDTYTIACIESLRQITYPHFEILIVDNGSRTESITRLKEKIKGIPILENGENLGYGGAANVGIRYGLEQGADYILLLNNDTTVKPDFLQALVEAAEEDPRIGIVGSKILCWDDPTRVQAAGMDVYWGIGTFNRKDGEINDPKLNRREFFRALTGCSILVRSKVFKEIGLFNEKYFLYAEDVEFCWRTQKKYKILYEPKSVIYHKDGGSSPSPEAQGRVAYYSTRNKCYFMLSKGSKVEFLFFISHYFFSRSIKALRWYLKGEKRKGWGVYRGFLDFLRKKQGPPEERDFNEFH